MARLRTRRFITVLFAVCTTLLFLSFSGPYQPVFISNIDSDRRFSHKMMMAKSWRLTKYVIDKSSSDDANTIGSYEFEKIIREYIEKHKFRIREETENPFSFKTSFKDRLWFMKGGEIRPTPIPQNAVAILWPEQDNGDRIVSQLMYAPIKDRLTINTNRSRSALKTILLYYGINGWGNLQLGRRTFIKDRCPVNTCTIHTSRASDNVDAILFRNKFSKPRLRRPPNQVWILYLLECPLNTQIFKNLKHVINWTATYRHDSDIVTPYEKYVPYNVGSLYQPFQEVVAPQATVRNYAKAKTKKVAWFVSNCNAKNKRLQYAYELSNYIDVDVFGSCGKMFCSRKNDRQCMDVLDKEYKFYLSFENSNCKDYITEKFFVNGLSRDLIPIVMGARREDYLRVSPPHSYIHVDDFPSPKELADYLLILDANDTLFNEYFAWKGSGEFVNTHFWCRLCALLHAPYEHKSYVNIHDWWNKPGTCDAKNRRNK